MSLSVFCLKRPVFTVVLQCFLLIAGIIGYQHLPLREYPNINIPVVSISTYYPGADASIVEHEVTKQLEDALAGLEGVDYIASSSAENTSTIQIYFQVSRAIEAAANDVRDKIHQIRGLLPTGVKDPLITKADSDNNAMMWLVAYADETELMALSDVVQTHIKNRLELVEGVSSLYTVGERTKAMRLWLDNDRMARHNMTIEEVVQALQKQNLSVPSGRIEGPEREFSVLTNTKLSTVEAFENIILRRDQTSLLRLKEVAEVVLAPESERFATRFQGRSGIALGIMKQSMANPLDVSARLKELLPSLQGGLPPGIHLELAYDSTDSIRESIQGVYHALIEAIILVALVIFLFLRDIRITLIPLVTIPISLIGVFALMQVLVFSLNLLTLLALVLAIGLVVDDAIVVLENCHRHQEAGLSSGEAALKGMQEISSAVVAMTLTLAAVFVPLVFMPGRIGRLFSEFAVVLAGSVLISGFVALSWTPVLCRAWIRIQKKPTAGWSLHIQKGLEALEIGYQKVLTYCLDRPRALIKLLGVVVLISGGLWMLLPSQLAPDEDTGKILLMGHTDTGSTLAYTDRYARQVEAFVKESPAVSHFFTLIGSPSSHGFMVFAILKPWAERTLSQAEVLKGFYEAASNITGAQVFAFAPPSSLGEGGGGQGNVNVHVLTSGAYGELRALMGKIQTRLQQELPALLNVQSELKADKPHLEVFIDRDKAASLGIGVEQIAQALQILLGGQEVSSYQEGSERYKVLLQLHPSARQGIQDITQLSIRSQTGLQIPLETLVRVEETRQMSSLDHLNKLREAQITASTSGSLSLGKALDKITQIVQEEGGPSVQVFYGGESKALKSAGKTIFFVFSLALLVIYLVLSAQFESFVHPITIMMTVPLAMAGALLFLWVSGGSLNIYSQIALITLIGLITKHGILMVSFANQLRLEGHSVVQAVYQAAVLRFRPILMTTLATLLGALPLMLAQGSGSAGRQQIGLTVVGGMLLGTLLTLFVIPVVHSSLLNLQLKKEGFDEKATY